jgi:hypothetical protein
MASIVSAGTTSATALNMSADTSGVLQLASNNGTVALTVDTSQNVGIGASPSSSWVGTRVLSLGVSASFYGDGQTLNWPAGMLVNGARTGANTFVYTAPTASSIAAYRYEMGNNVAGHAWFYAGTGTLGSTISYTQQMTLDTNGRFYVNTTTEPGSNDSAVVIKAGGTSKSRCLSLEAVTTGSVIVQTFRNPNGQVGHIETNASATAYVTSSDYRLKEDVQPMTGALAKVALLKPVTYKWKVDGSSSQGFIAHELQEVVPEAVSGAKDGTGIQQYEITPAVLATYDEEGNVLTPAIDAVMGEREVPAYQGIDTSFLVATLTAAIQELNAKVTALENK